MKHIRIRNRIERMISEEGPMTTAELQERLRHRANCPTVRQLCVLMSRDIRFYPINEVSRYSPAIWGLKEVEVTA